MAEAVESPSDTVTRTVVTTELPPSNGERLVLRLHKPKPTKKVEWKEDVVDNEFMGKKKSKCCCIYTKPRKFGESDSESGSDSDDHDCCHEQKVARQPKHTH